MRRRSHGHHGLGHRTIHLGASEVSQVPAQVPVGDDANETSILEHGKASESALLHLGLSDIEMIVWSHGDGILGHVFFYQHLFLLLRNVLSPHQAEQKLCLGFGKVAPAQMLRFYRWRRKDFRTSENKLSALSQG